MKEILKKSPKLMFGLFLYGLGIVMCIYAGLGMSPWDMLNYGISNHTGLTMGQINIILSVIIVIINFAVLKVKVGMGTVFNMICIGLFMDLIMFSNLLPVCTRPLSGLIMLLLGIAVIGLAMYFYIGAGLGTGPRDGLFIGLAQKLNKSPKFSKTVVELIVCVTSMLLGIMPGIGTIIFVFLSGPITQKVCMLLHMDLKTVHHVYIDDYFKRKDE